MLLLGAGVFRVDDLGLVLALRAGARDGVDRLDAGVAVVLGFDGVGRPLLGVPLALGVLGLPNLPLSPSKSGRRSCVLGPPILLPLRDPLKPLVSLVGRLGAVPAELDEGSGVSGGEVGLGLVAAFHRL